jgi:hypothetical protein
MQEDQIPVDPIIVRPLLNPMDEEIHARIQLGNNYSTYNKINHTNLEVYSEFSCPAA